MSAVANGEKPGDKATRIRKDAIYIPVIGAILLAVTLHHVVGNVLEGERDARRQAIQKERLRDETCKRHPEHAAANALVAQACARAEAIGRYGETAIAIDLKLCEAAPMGSPFCKDVVDKAADLWKKTDDLMRGG